MTFEGFRYYLIFQLFVLYSSFLSHPLNHEEGSIIEHTETRAIPTYRYMETRNDTSSTPADPWINNSSTSNSLSPDLRNSKLPSTSYDLTKFNKSTYQSEVGIVTMRLSISLKVLRKIISETPIRDGDLAVLGLEIFIMMATGNHFIIPPNGDKKIEKRLEKNVRALGSLFLDLRYTYVLFDIAETLFINKTIRSNQSDQMDSSKRRVTIKKMQEYLLNFVDEIFNAIDDRDDSLTNEFFKHRKSFANKGFTYFSFDNLTSEIIEERNMVELLNNPDFKKFIIHTEFIQMKRRNRVVDLFYEMAKESKLTINLNEIYVNILDKIAKRFTIVDYEKMIRYIMDELITTIKTHEPLRKAYENANIDYEKELQSFEMW